jgi:23S rRNA (guanosine2251-2'-O)-methyltransferase
VILPERHSAELNGACAKAASGAVDIVPIVTVTNLARALQELAAAGLEVIGLDAAADQTIDQVTRGARPAIVLGSEGEGLRRLVRERCTRLVRLPISPRIESLNVSVAAGIALYALARPGGVA